MTQIYWIQLDKSDLYLSGFSPHLGEPEWHSPEEGPIDFVEFDSVDEAQEVICAHSLNNAAPTLAPQGTLLPRLAADARPQSENDWGSDRQVQAETLFIKEAIRLRLLEEDSDEFHQHTTDEFIDAILERHHFKTITNQPS